MHRIEDKILKLPFVSMHVPLMNLLINEIKNKFIFIKLPN